MATGPLADALRHLRRWRARGDMAARGDEQLLEQFARHRDEVAFEALVARHGPMVLEVCRRALFDAAAAEDAFQATFLVLIQKAGSIRNGELLAGWLHGVASRIAARARVETARRRARESASTTAAQATDPLAEMTMRECLTALDEEITRLPARQRAPLVLCYLEGRARDEAAHELGYSLATLDRRLKAGRERLRGRLAARGVTLSGALLAAALGEQAGRAAVPASLKTATVKLAVGTAAGARVTALAEGVLKGMFLSKLKVVTALLVFNVVLGVGTGALLLHTWAADSAGRTPGKVPVESAPAAGKPGTNNVAADRKKLPGTTHPDAGSRPAGKAAVKEHYRVRVFLGVEKHPASQWQMTYLDQVMTLGAAFDVRAQYDAAGAKGVLQRTTSGRLQFKGRVSIGYNAGEVDAPVELGKAIKAKGGLAGLYGFEDFGTRKFAIFVRFERSKPERPGKVKVIKKSRDIHEKVVGRDRSKGDEVLVVPGPQPQKQTLSQWFQSRLKAKNDLTADQETWVLFRSVQVSDYDRISIERIERQGTTFTVTMNHTLYLGDLYRNITYHEVHGINLGKLPAGDYTVQWIIRLSNRDVRTTTSAGCWQELKRSINVRAAQEPATKKTR